ncbi:MAG: diguanylate cyclase [Chloroflexi bacterium]|nr:diguanylate cyclase [Chloroflexota bacterium]
MKEQESGSRKDKFSELRQRAKQFLSEGMLPDGEPTSLEHAQQLVTELQIHQIELEMQNDELRKMQVQLASERERYADLYNFAPVAYFIFDAQDVILDLNLAAAELLGNERKFLVDHPITPYITSDSLETFIRHRQLALSTGATQHCELIVRPRDGMQQHVHAQTVALPSDSDSGHRWRSVMTNITERKQADEMIRRLSRAVEQSPASIVISDIEGNIEYVNPRFTQVTGYAAREVLGKNTRILKSDQTPAETHRQLWETILAGLEWKGEFVNKKKHGELYFELATISPITDENGVVTHFMAIKEDITERKFIAEALQESNIQLIATLNALPDLMLEMSRDGIVRNFHAARPEMLHALPKEFMDKDIGRSMPEEAARAIKTALAEAARGDGTSSGAVYSLTRPQGVCWYEISVASKGDPQSPETNFIVLTRDITDRKLAETNLQRANKNLQERLLEIEALQERLREQAVRDQLTGLFNRHYLQETLDREIARALRSDQPVSLVIMDVDHFKRINDSYGHRAGDLVLKTLGDLIRTNIRASDVPCRYGGEEFLLVMPEASLQVAYERARFIAARISELRVPHESVDLRITVSIGIAVLPLHGDNGEDVLLRADRALYQAKELGRNRIVVYREGINPDTLRN